MTSPNFVLDPVRCNRRTTDIPKHVTKAGPELVTIRENSWTSILMPRCNTVELQQPLIWTVKRTLRRAKNIYVYGLSQVLIT